MARESDSTSSQPVEQPGSLEERPSTDILQEQAPMENTAASRSRAANKRQAIPIAAAIGAVGLTLVGGLLGSLLKRNSRKKRPAVEKAPAIVSPAIASAVETPAVTMPSTVMDDVESAAARDSAAALTVSGQDPVDLSPFGSPVGNTPVMKAAMKAASRAVSTASNDGDDASDNASVRDQRTSLVDAAQLQKTLKQMQEMAEENRKLSQFMSEYKMNAEKLSKLEEENQALRGVTQQLEQELHDIKINTLPHTGAELEIFKNAVHVPTSARSVCSNDDSVVLGASTASVDGANPGGRVRRENIFKQLMAHIGIQGGPSTGTSQPSTPRSAGVSGGGASVDGATGGRQRKQPRPEEAAAIGQAVYQLLDSFSARML